MQVSVFAVGRMKKGAEQELSQRYFDRFAKMGAATGFVFTGIKEIAESNAATSQSRRLQEAAKLQENLGGAACLVLLDERGKDFASPQWADWIGARRDAGDKALVFALGGPDGHAPQLYQRADLLLSFGRATWPHQLARILLAEQLYRAATILNNHPYHRR